MNVVRYFELGFMLPQTIATVTLRHNPQLFERFPGLKIIVCHCGGFVDRMGEGAPYRAIGNDVDRNLFYDSAAYDLDFLALGIKQRGPAQIVFGTEAPGSGREIRPGTELSADDFVPLFESDPALDFLTEEQKLDILHNTPAKLVPGLEDTSRAERKGHDKGLLGRGSSCRSRASARAESRNLAASASVIPAEARNASVRDSGAHTKEQGGVSDPLSLRGERARVRVNCGGASPVVPASRRGLPGPDGGRGQSASARGEGCVGLRGTVLSLLLG